MKGQFVKKGCGFGVGRPILVLILANAILSFWVAFDVVLVLDILSLPLIWGTYAVLNSGFLLLFFKILFGFLVTLVTSEATG